MAAKLVLGRLRREWALPIGFSIKLAFLYFGKAWLGDFSSLAWVALVLAWLFGAILVCAFPVVRHAGPPRSGGCSSRC